MRGYLQAYAKYVRIDTQDLLLRYQHHLATAPDAKRSALRSHYLYVRERYQEKRRLVSAIVLFVVMLSVVGAFFFLKSQRDKHKRLAHTADQIQKSDDTKPSTPASESPLARDMSKPEKTAERPVEKAPEKAAEKPSEPEKAPVAKAAEPEKTSEKPVAAPPPETAKTPAPPPSPAVPPPPAPEPPKATEAAPPAANPEPTTENKPSSADGSAAAKKNYQLALKANVDVWFRYQTDEDEVKDLTLRSGKTMFLKANKVIKIFSGNLGAFKATLNGKELDSLGSSKGVKSAVLPESEAANYKLPLFPQFQVKHAAKAPQPEQDSAPSGDSAPVPDKPSENSGSPAPATP